MKTIALKRLTLLFTTTALSVISGCTSLSGLGGSSSLSCALPAGSTCKPVIDVYKNTPPTTTTTSTSTSTNQSAPSAASVVGSGVAAAQGEASPSPLTVPVSAVQSMAAPRAYYAGNAASSRPAPTSGTPVRSATRMMRIWIAPYEDDEGALRDHGYLYVMVDAGRWQVEHNRATIVRQYGPIKGPKVSNTAPATQSPDQQARALITGAASDSASNGNNANGNTTSAQVTE
jgi:conjugal transfer pilus assembly protein TraV